MPADTHSLLRHLRRLAVPPASAAPSDACLLERCVRRRDEDAFAALVGRHGPMVYGLCRRLLADVGAAEDCFQATFVVLARRAAAVRPPEALAGWLYGVARRVALKARPRRLPRPLPAEHLLRPAPVGDALDALTAREALYLLDEELLRLPAAYHQPLVCCCLEGLSQEEAAQRLGWTPGSVKGRLERGRKHLHIRLAKRGLTLSTALAAVEVSRGAASVPAALAANTTRTALAGPTKAGVAALAGDAFRSAPPGTGKLAVALLLAIGATTLGSGVAMSPPAGTEPPGVRRGSVAEPAEKPGPAALRPGQDLYGDPLPPDAVARLGTVRFRHSYGPTALACSPNGKTLAATDGEDIRIWDMATGKVIRTYHGHASHVYCLAYSADGEHLASGSSDKTIRLWDTATGKELRRFEGH
jgi:RNA polymerase sigma factor (sigma-70 family)